jgi:hypothetical protein
MQPANVDLDITHHCPPVYRVLTLENHEQAIPSLLVVSHELDAGVPFKPAGDGPEDFIMKEN